MNWPVLRIEWVLISLFGLAELKQLLTSIQVFVALRGRPRQATERRPSRLETWFRALYCTAVAMFVIAFVPGAPPSKFGFRVGSWSMRLLYGFILYALFLVVFEQLAIRLRMLGWPEASRREMFHVLPRRPIDKVVMVVTLVVLNPVREEFVYRGVFVYLLGAQLGNVPVAIGVGLVLCLVYHLYQGMRPIAFHIAFYSATVWLLYSWFGLAGCIGFHSASGCLFLRTARARFMRYRRGRLASRPAKPAEARVA